MPQEKKAVIGEDDWEHRGEVGELQLKWIVRGLSILSRVFA
jgi:hypothetical protein